jgi:hypothetical protein
VDGGGVASAAVPGGLFRDDDPREVVDFVDRKLLNRGFVRKVFGGRTTGVEIRPAITVEGRAERKEAKRALPHVSIFRPRLTNRHPTLYLWRGSGAKPEELAVPEGATAPAIVAQGLVALRAVSPPGPGWEWEPIVEVDTTPA